jgi:hypothetical protein
MGWRTLRTTSASLGARREVVAVGEVRRVTGAGLDEHLEAELAHLLDRVGRRRDPALVRINLLRDPDGQVRVGHDGAPS